jgi:hypothetical protein
MYIFYEKLKYRKKGKGKSGPNILEDLDQEGANQGDLKKGVFLLTATTYVVKTSVISALLALKILDGGKGVKGFGFGR